MIYYGRKCLGLFLLVCCLTMTIVEAHHWTADKNDRAGWNQEAQARAYFHHSDLQLQWAMRALAEIKLTPDAHILDFGCGDGKLSSILAAQVPHGSVLGVDVSYPMIHLAQRKFGSRTAKNLRFQVIEDLSDVLDEPALPFDWVTSFCVFHLIDDPSSVLKGMRQLLREGGHVLLVIPAHSPPGLIEAANQTFEEIGLKPPWSEEEYSQKKQPPMRAASSCCSCIESAGFLITQFEEESRPYVFYDRQELTDWFVGTLASNWGVPWEEAPVFFRRTVELWTQLYPDCQNEDGSIDFACKYFVCLARKPVGR